MKHDAVTPGPHPVEYWYNTTTGKVEEGQQSPVTQLWGPYATYEEAAHAMVLFLTKDYQLTLPPLRTTKAHPPLIEGIVLKALKYIHKENRNENKTEKEKEKQITKKTKS